MTMVPVTSVCAGLLALLYLVLTARVIQARTGVAAIGTAGDARLERRVRVHGNCAEYVPFGLLLLGLDELAGYPGWLVATLGGVFAFGRVAHAIGVSAEREDLRVRVVGMACTLTPLGVLATLAVWAGLGSVAVGR